MNNLIKTTLLLLALVLPSIASAYDFEVDGIYYDINGTEVTVTEGDNKYTGDVIIPESVSYNGTTYSVTSVGYYCDWPSVKGCPFRYCIELKSVTLPKTITVIGNGAFSDCILLSSIVIPDSVIAIGEDAFSGCTGMSSATIPSSVTRIECYAFANCHSLSSIDIYGSPYIGEYAFEGCDSLTKVNISCIDAWCGVHCVNHTSNPLYYAKHLYLNDEEIVDLVIPDNTILVGRFAFVNCECFKSVTIPTSIIKIEGCAFWGCSNLEKVNIFDIGTWCAINFEYGYLTNYEDMSDWMDDAANPLAYAHHLFLNGQEIKHLIIPNTVTSISQFAFTRCRGLISVTIPNTVTSINDCAFYACLNLKSISIPNSVQRIGVGSFGGCSSMTNIEIGNSVFEIGNKAFWACNNVSTISCFASTPPVCGSSTFFDYAASSYSATLHVPAASLGAYFTAPVWCDFENVVGDAVAPTGISISKDSVEMHLGEQMMLTAMVTPANASIKDVTWISTDTTVATVEEGMVTPVGFGECDIVAMCFGMRAVCHVTVANRIMLDQHEVMLLPNHMLTLIPSAPAMPTGFKATSSDPTVAAVRVMSGKVQMVGLKEGIASITVSSTDGTAVPATCLVTVYTELGDVNMDGFIDIDDVTAVISYVLGDSVDTFKAFNADQNGDDIIDIDDITALISNILGV